MSGKNKPKARKAAIKPKFGSGLLAIDTTLSEDKLKYDAHNIFTIFWAWAYPCQRNWIAVITLFDVPPLGEISVAVSLRRRRTRNLISLYTRNITIHELVKGSDPQEVTAAVTVPIRLNHEFAQPGRYRLIFNFSEYPGQLEIPFEVRTREWPEFSPIEQEFVRDNPSAFKNVRVTLNCPFCNHVYNLEDSILDDFSPPSGSLKFPEDGNLKCNGCDRIISVKDIQGQMRSSLKQIVYEAMERS